MKELKKKICPECHKEFSPKQNRQKYCCEQCRKKYQHQNQETYNEKEDNKNYENMPIIRKFNCLNCGAEVIIRNPKCQKTKFCCSKCEREYWRHPKNKEKFQYREFECLTCHKKVIITKQTDQRRKYCSKECAEKHRAKEKTELILKNKNIK